MQTTENCECHVKEDIQRLKFTKFVDDAIEHKES